MLILSLFLVPGENVIKEQLLHLGWAPSSRVPLISLLEVEILGFMVVEMPGGKW